MKKATTQRKKVSIEFDEEHLGTLVAALEVYSRLRSGQISIAMDTVFWDANLSWKERQYLENTIRYTVFPAKPRREYDGHGEYYDQYNNEYGDDGCIREESDDWKSKKNRHHLYYPNSYFGVGCEEMKDGTVAWEIKKVIEQYQHYQRNDGCRKGCDVSGDGPMQISKVPIPKVLNFDTTKTFEVPKKAYDILNKAYDKKDWETMWAAVDLAFEKKPLPKGSSSKIIKQDDGNWVVIVKEPYFLDEKNN